MGRIVDLKAQGLSWEKVAVRQMYEKARTVDGREWSIDQVRRAYNAELLLRSAPPSNRKRCCSCGEVKPGTAEFFGRRASEPDGCVSGSVGVDRRTASDPLIPATT